MILSNRASFDNFIHEQQKAASNVMPSDETLAKINTDQMNVVYMKVLSSKQNQRNMLE